MLPRPHLWLNTARRFLPVECCSKKKVTERKRKEKEHKTNGRRSPPNSKQEKNALQTKKGDFLIKQPSKKNVTRERDGKKWKSKKENGRQEAWPGASGNAIVIDSLAETIVVIQLNIPINEVAYRDLSNYRRAIRFLLFIDSVPLFHGSQPNRPDRVRRFRFIHSALIEFRGGPPPNSMAPIIDRLNRWNSIVYPPSSFHFGIVCVFFCVCRWKFRNLLAEKNPPCRSIDCSSLGFRRFSDSFSPVLFIFFLFSGVCFLLSGRSSSPLRSSSSSPLASHGIFNRSGAVSGFFPFVFFSFLFFSLLFFFLCFFTFFISLGTSGRTCRNAPKPKVRAAFRSPFFSSFFFSQFCPSSARFFLARPSST